MRAMWRVRFGSYSTRPTPPAMPSLSRLKSMTRYFWREPPPTWRVVMRPEWLRAPVLFWCSVNGRYGPPLYRCERSILTDVRAPGEVCFDFIQAMSVGPRSALGPGFVVDSLAGRKADIGLLPVLCTAE